MRTKITRSLRKEGISVIGQQPLWTLAWTYILTKAQRARDAVDWEYVGRWAAGIILVAGMLFLLIHLTISNLQIGS